MVEEEEEEEEEEGGGGVHVRLTIEFECLRFERATSASLMRICSVNQKLLPRVPINMITERNRLGSLQQSMLGAGHVVVCEGGLRCGDRERRRCCLVLFSRTNSDSLHRDASARSQLFCRKLIKI